MKYLLVHLPEAEKGDPAQVIIESTSPPLPAPPRPNQRERQKRLPFIVNIIECY